MSNGTLCRVCCLFNCQIYCLIYTVVVVQFNDFGTRWFDFLTSKSGGKKGPDPDPEHCLESCVMWVVV